MKIKAVDLRHIHIGWTFSAPDITPITGVITTFKVGASFVDIVCDDGMKCVAVGPHDQINVEKPEERVTVGLSRRQIDYLLQCTEPYMTNAPIMDLRVLLQKAMSELDRG